MTQPDDIYSTGRIASPFHSPDGNAFALYHDGITTLWFYAGSNKIVIETTAPDSHRPEIKKRIMKKLKAAALASNGVIQQAEEAIVTANQSIAHAKKAITQNQNDVVSFNAASMELDRQWSDDEDQW